MNDTVLERMRVLEPRIRQYEHGPRQGESIVLLHGGNSAGWSWLEAVDALDGRHVLTPDLPGYAGRAEERWPGLKGAAEDLADLIRSLAVGGRAHVVGLSLGGFVATQLVHSHPELVRSCIISGSALSGYSAVERAVIRPQVGLWRQRWFWMAQAFAFRVPADGREIFAFDGAAPSTQTNRAMYREITRGFLPDRFAYDGPFLAVAGQHDVGSVHRAFPAIRRALPQAETWVAPRMHHAWNAEDPALFARMVSTFADTGRWEA